MQVAEIQFTPWDKVYWFDPAGINLKIGDKVIVHTDLGMEIGQLLAFKDLAESELKDKELKVIIRKANLSDIEKSQKKQLQATEALKKCRTYISELGLQMKLVDVHFSFDGGRVTFAFTADSRIDFRELVKKLTHHFQKSVRLYQLGVRDEAKLVGQFGPCGLKLCCRGFLNDLGQVTGECVEAQQIGHRGSERLSGPCGRLKCCLRFEQNLYQDLVAKLPAIGTRVVTDHGRGEIIGHNILKQSVKVRLDGDDRQIVEIPIKDKKEKNK